MGYFDFDWAGDADLRRSTAAYVIMVNSVLFFWSSRRLSTVCFLLTEAEYAAVTEAVKELVVYKKLSEGLGFFISGLLDLYCDFQSVIVLLQNSVYYVRIKYVEIKYYYIRQLIA